MPGDDETYEEFTKRYRAERGQPAQGPKVSAVNKQLIIMGVAFVFATLFFNFVGRGLDEAVAADQADHVDARQKANPWSKD